MNYPTVEINNEFPKRVFYCSSVNLDAVPPEPDQNYMNATTFRADLPDIIQPTDDTQNVSWHIVSIGMTPNAIHNPPGPNEPLAGATIEYRLLVDPDLLRNSLIYGKFDNPPNSVLSSSNSTVRPAPGEWPNEDVATLAQYYDRAHLARIALVTQVYESEAAAAVGIDNTLVLSGVDRPVYNYATAFFRILATRLQRETRGAIPMASAVQLYYDLRTFHNGDMSIDHGEIQRNAIPGTLHDYWINRALPNLQEALISEAIELEEPYFPSREKLLSRLLEKANLSSLIHCHIPELSDDLVSRVSLELHANASVPFLRQTLVFNQVLREIRTRISQFCGAYIHYCTQADSAHVRVGIAANTVQPRVVDIADSIYHLFSYTQTTDNDANVTVERDFPVPYLANALFPFTTNVAGVNYEQIRRNEQTEALTNRMMEYLFSITTIRDITLNLNASAIKILGDSLGEDGNSNWIDNLSRNRNTRTLIEEWGLNRVGSLPIWSNGLNGVSLQFQKDCTAIKSFTKDNQPIGYATSYTPPIPMGEYLNNAELAAPNPNRDSALIVSPNYFLATPFSLQCILDFFKSHDDYWWKNVTDAYYYNFGLDEVDNDPADDWYILNRATGAISYLNNGAVKNNHLGFRLPQSGVAGAYRDTAFQIYSMEEDYSLFNRLLCYQNTIPIFKTLTNSSDHCLYQVPNSSFLLYSTINYLRFAAPQGGSGYSFLSLVTAERQPSPLSLMDQNQREAFRQFYLCAGSPFITGGNVATPIYAFENNFIGLEWVDVTFRNLMNNTMVAAPASRFSRSSQISTRLFMSTESRSYVQNSQVSTNMCFGSIELRTLEYLQIDILDPSFRHSLQNARLYFEIEFNQRTVTEQESEKAANFQNWTPAEPEEMERVLASVSSKKRRRSSVRIVS